MMKNERRYHMIFPYGNSPLSTIATKKPDEEPLDIPGNFNYEKILAGPTGGFIARHFADEGMIDTEAIQLLLDENEFYEPLMYLAWLWVHGFVVEIFPGFYNVDIRVPFNFDNYECYGDGGISLKGNMDGYQLYALEDFLSDEGQVRGDL